MDWAQFKGIHDHFNHEDMLDAGEAFHIQVSNFGKTHIFFYYDPFDYKKTRPDADKFWRLIKHLEKTFKFEFSDRMPKSLGSK